jgi:hypothetical protein
LSECLVLGPGDQRRHLEVIEAAGWRQGGGVMEIARLRRTAVGPQELQ